MPGRPISRRGFVGGGLAAAGLGLLPRRPPPAERPNILFILADDLGYGDLSCFGRPDYRTPTIDGLSQDGLRFTCNYTAGAVCTPTRVALMTGRYPARLPIGLAEPLAYGDTTVGLPPDHPTVASRLKAAGYETALVGKWHMGYLPENGPLQHGFDEFFGFLSGGVDYFTHQEPGGKPDLYEGNDPVERSGYLTDLFTDRAVEIIRRQRNTPFYLALHYNAPHWPWEGPDDSASSQRYRAIADTVKDRFVLGFADNGSPGIYAAMMQRLDECVGRVLRALAATGLERETLVVFTSDNGGERWSYNAPLTAAKGSLHEGGIRVPAIVRWPGRVPAGKVTDQAIISMDWSATMLALGGATPDPAYPLDGVDLTPIWTGGGTAVLDRALCWRTRKENAVRRGHWKYLQSGKAEALYDIPADPGEHTDRARQVPKVVASLREEFEAWNAEMVPFSSPLAPTR
jgi:arylsulfatase A-like enzyme